MNNEYKLKNVMPGSIDLYNNSRIVFTKFDLSGLHDFHEYSTDKRFFKYFEFPPHNNIADSIKYINQAQDRMNDNFSNGCTMYWYIRLRGSMKVIGSLALVGVDFNKSIGQVGKGLSPSYWGKGYMSEAMDIYMDYCFGLLGLNKLWSVTRIDNIPNITLMRKKGFVITDRLDNYYKNLDSAVHDAVILTKSV
jgi:ribosomal-protein-alanine N-acetyltransferase